MGSRQRSKSTSFQRLSKRVVAFRPAFAAILIGIFLTLATGRAHAQALTQPVAVPLLPSSVAFDAAGNLYFADTNRHVVYESSLAGVLSVVAGDGVQGFSGDGGAATSAELSSPQGVAVGPDGTLYIADTGNQRVRVVAGGLIATLAGNGTAGFAGDGAAPSDAPFRGPNALAIDASGAILISDAGNERVRRISAGVIQTIAGNGLQGFAGDGGPATAAELDTPIGLAVSGDGRIFVADSHNQRIRVIAVSGVITTFAGNGVAGFAGDGGPATSAKLSLPRGLIVTSSGTVIFADSNNQHLRLVDASGQITTIAGSGVQGTANDGAAAASIAMNSPRAVSVSTFGAPVYADALNHLVRESVANGNVYTPAGLAPGRTSTITLSTSSTNGQTVAAVSVVGSTGTAYGVVELLDGESILTQAALIQGAATFAAQTLSAGSHVLSAAYLGDGVNPAATTAAIVIDSGSGVITASAIPVTVHYGQAIPLLTGTLSGAPPQGVIVTFTTSASILSPVGSYPIWATLSGPQSGNYTLAMSPASGALQILPAASITTEQPLAQNSYAGLPLLLSASVASTTQGTPTGVVTFLDSGTTIASATLVSGGASGTYLLPTMGTHAIVASYAGDGNFTASTSPATTTTVAAMPDFAVSTVGSTTQTVAGGDAATYAMTVAPLAGAFTGVVDFGASGLPTGATAFFSPPQIVPGSTSVNVTMTVQTSAALVARERRALSIVMFAGLLCPVCVFNIRRRSKQSWWPICALLAATLSLTACGARSVSTPLLGGKTYALTITGTSTNLAGSLISHSTQVTLVVE